MSCRNMMNMIYERIIKNALYIYILRSCDNSNVMSHDRSPLYRGIIHVL